MTGGNAAPSRRTLRDYLDFVAFEHTAFALPFAYAGMLLASNLRPGWATVGWITLAMVGARTAAMAINRLVDAEIDARNPRTEGRHLPAGRLRRADGLLLAGAGLGALTVAGLALNPLTAALLPVAVAFLVIYPYTKRFTWACHLWLGVTIGAGAAGGYIAVTGRFEPATLLLWLAVATWIAGFDVIYALLDRDVDVRQGLHSVPARFGVARALDVSAGLHLTALAALLTLPVVSPLGVVFAAVVALGVAPLLVHGQVLVRRHGPAHALRAFNANLWVSGLVLLGLLADLGLRALG